MLKMTSMNGHFSEKLLELTNAYLNILTSLDTDVTLLFIYRCLFILILSLQQKSTSVNKSEVGLVTGTKPSHHFGPGS